MKYHNRHFSMQKIYQERKDTNSKIAADLNAQLKKIAIIRVLSFLALVILSVYFANERSTWGIWLSLAILTPIFMVMVSWYGGVKKKQRFHQFMADVNEEELQRIEHKLVSEQLNGHEFANAKHAYSYDLDIFGKKSLFLKLNRTSTQLGKHKLANWLEYKASKDEIYNRQEAVSELIPKLEWRQEFQAIGRFSEDTTNQAAQLLNWMTKDFEFDRSPWVYWGSKLFPVISLIGVVLAIITDWPTSLVLAMGLLPSLVIAKKLSKLIEAVIEQTSDCVKVLRNYASLIEKIENEQFQHPHLKALHQQLGVAQSEEKKIKASEALQKLSRILYHLELRKNAYFYVLFIIWTLYDVHWFFALDNWKRKHHQDIANWLEAVAEFEALNSLAGFAYANPDFAMPKLSDKEYCLQASNLGHPLLPAHERVCNDFNLAGKGKTAIITGSNMSGKSTFERTISVNIVLALAGAPVCATQMELSEIFVFTSMRTQDSLAENVSGFYAELKRLRQLLDQVEAGLPTFYVLDEVLKGTNSQDRQNGAKAIIHKLASMPAFGLISTHDLELSELESQFPDRVQNFSFNSQIIDGKLLFNYKISQAVCHSFSASKLMETIGIQMEENI